MCLTYAASGEKRLTRLCRPWLAASRKKGVLTRSVVAEEPLRLPYRQVLQTKSTLRARRQPSPQTSHTLQAHHLVVITMRCNMSLTSRTHKAQITPREVKLASRGMLRSLVVGDPPSSLSLLLLVATAELSWWTTICCLDSPVQEVHSTLGCLLPPSSFSLSLSLVDSPVQEVPLRATHFASLIDFLVRDGRLPLPLPPFPSPLSRRHFASFRPATSC